MSETSRKDLIKANFTAAAELHQKLTDEQVNQISQAADWMVAAIRAGNKIIWFGNGGSATQSQHMAGEFVGRFCKERRSLPSISLTENMASVTAISNDYSYEDLFLRQLQGLGAEGDVAVGISTSGNSTNVLKALEHAKQAGIKTIALTGGIGGKMKGKSDVCIVVDSKVTARVQEVHLTIGHTLCQLVEDALD